MEFRQFKTFVTITKLGSFVQAADSLGYAQSTVTTHIQALENELGFKVFERLGHRVILTSQGKSLLPYAEQMLKLLTGAAAIAANPDTPQGTLTIGTNESLGTYRLPALLKDYRKAYPEVELVLKFANCDKICADIKENNIDVGLIINDRDKENEIIAEVVSGERMLFLAAPDHPLARLEAAGPEDLAGTCVILTEPDCSYRLTMEKIFRDYRISPQSTLEASSIETIKQLVMLGLGIAMLPAFTVEKELAEGRICALSWNGPVPEYSVRLLYHKDKWLSPTLRAFFKAARQLG